MNHTKVRDLLFSLDVILLTFIVCMNINRYLLESYSNIVYYTFYFIFFVVCSLNYFKSDRLLKIELKKGNMLLMAAVSTLLIYVAIRSFEHGMEGVEAGMKFMITGIIAVMASKFSLNKIALLYKLIIIYNVIYCVVLDLSLNRAIKQMVSGYTNYLVITLTIGLLLSLSLCFIVLSLYSMTSKKRLILFAAISGFALITMTNFNSRGSILIPIVTMGIVLLMISPSKPYRFIGVLLILAGLGYFGVDIYMNNASTYIYSRMMRLFNQTSTEMRVDLWKHYIAQIVDRKWYLLGGGTNSSRLIFGYYPHNLYLQLLGEFGIIGFFAGIIITALLCRSAIKSMRFIRKNSVNPETVVCFYLTVSATVYYWISFMKSFSFYDAYPLWIFGALLFKEEAMIKGKREVPK